MDKVLRRSSVLVILFVACILTGGVEAATLEVGPSGYPYTSIQAAISAAGAGDIVLVHDGTYVENISFSGKAITVKSANGAASTIINGNGSSQVVTFGNGEGSASVLDGFTIMNGYGGGGIWGGGIRCSSSSPTITNCIISGNTADVGAGISCEYTSSPTITNCTISGNTATINGGGICCDPSSLSVTNSILWGNAPDQIYKKAGSLTTVTYSDVNEIGYDGIDGNISQNPLFVDPTNGNFRLQPTSPCIDAATSDGAPLTDMKGSPRFDLPWIPNTGGGTYPYYDMGALELAIQHHHRRFVQLRRRCLTDSSVDPRRWNGQFHFPGAESIGSVQPNHRADH